MQDVEAILSGLTDAQREAATHVEGPLLVVAGAGSGKTRVITRRVACLCCQGIPPFRIVAVTFTNKAAGEMRERIERLSSTGGAWVSTFHSLCARMLRVSGESLGLDRNFTIYDRDDQLKAVKEAMHRLDIGGSLTPGAALNGISGAKGQLWNAKELAQQADGFREELVAQIYAAYERLLASNAALDFDDLLMHVALAFERDAEFRDRWQRRFQFVLIDEYQDTNRAQYLIARGLAAEHRNLCATGDADQSIYGWRGANIRNILGFTKDYPDAKVVMLEQNFRSTATILRGANSVIEHNAQRHERSMWTENEEGVPIRFRLGDDAAGEADVVVGEIRKRHADGRQWGDFAAFYRTNAQSRSFEEGLVQASVPYRIVGAVEFYGRQEIKDLVAYLRVCVNERDGLSLARIMNRPTRGIGQRTVALLKKWGEDHDASLWAAVAASDEVGGLGPRARKAVAVFRGLIEGFRAAMDGPVAGLCQRVLDDSGYGKWLRQPGNEERLENVKELLAKAAGYDELDESEGLAGFLVDVSLVSDVDNLEGSADAVTLMTIHAAKGLEFPVVFITGLEEGLLPHANSSETDGEVEEERRLFYVGMTRAQKELILTGASERAQYAGRGWGGDDKGSGWSRRPSRFLAEVDRGALDEGSLAELAGFGASEDEWPAESAFRPRGRKGGARRGLTFATDEEAEPTPATKEHGFAIGDWVMHPKHGKGRIVLLQESERMTLATIVLAEGGKRVFALEHCRLTKL